MNSGAAHVDVHESAAPLTSGERERYHHLDAVRGFALMLGVFFHAAESFGPDNHYWAVVDVSTSELLEWIRFGCHSFRMELFFVIAGFFARLLLLKRGTKDFVNNRLQRILLPLVAGWFVLFPVLTFIWIKGWSVGGQLDQLQLPLEAQNLAPWQLWIGFFVTGAFLQRFDLTHLWFLHQLLVLYAVVLPLRGALLRLQPDEEWWQKWDRRFRSLLSGRWGLLAMAALTIPILYTMREWGVDTPKESLLPHPPTTLLYGLCFGLGWMLHRQPDLLPVFGRRCWARLGAGLALCALLGLAKVYVPYRAFGTGELLAARTAHLLLYSAMMWSFVYGFLGLFARYCATGNPWTRYIADASYWIYLVHLPLIVALQVLVGRWRIPWPIKYPLLLAVAIPMLYASYHYLARATWVGVVLNGRRYPRRWPWQETRVAEKALGAGARQFVGTNGKGAGRSRRP